MRSNRGIIITPEGEEFLGYARQVIDQYGILKARYVEKQRKEKFSVSMQHYTFAVKAFVETVKKAGMDSYEFAANETTTYDVMENVRNFKSEIGVLYLNDFNEQVLMKIIREKGLEFEELFACDTYVYLWSGHPLAGQSVISMEELDEYPCLSFDQGRNSSLYLAEEMKSTYDYKRLIKANDRATLLNFMIGAERVHAVLGNYLRGAKRQRLHGNSTQGDGKDADWLCEAQRGINQSHRTDLYRRIEKI